MAYAKYLIFLVASSLIMATTLPAAASDVPFQQTVANGDPSLVLRHAALPLINQVRGADRRETTFFTPQVKTIVETYFAKGDNARNFDADWLLGIQDWSGQVPAFSSLVISEKEAIVRLSLTSPGQAPIILRYRVLFTDRAGWKIDDVIYNGAPASLRDLIKRQDWCASLPPIAGRLCAPFDKQPCFLKSRLSKRVAAFVFRWIWTISSRT
jgi:hypothetical protein